MPIKTATDSNLKTAKHSYLKTTTHSNQVKAICSKLKSGIKTTLNA
jgi:hypothetical protein